MIHWIWQQPDWPNFNWDESIISPLLAKARLTQGKLLGLAQAFSNEAQMQINIQMLAEEMITSSAIEGEILNRASVRSSIAHRLGLSRVALNMPPDRYIEGVLDMMLDATENFEQLLDLNRLSGWQASLFPTGFSGIRKINIGKLRGKGEMQIVSGRHNKTKIHFIAPPQKILQKEMNQFLKWINKKKFETDGLIRTAIAHLWFEILHPFDDGNGRVERAIIDMTLAQDENLSTRFYSLSAEIMANRKSYYQILQETTSGTLNITEWLKWFINCYCNAIQRSMSIIDLICLKNKFWQLHASTILNERQQKVLNKMLDKGVDGYEGGMTTRKYVAINKTSRATAYRELIDMVEKNCLEPMHAKGRSSAYQIKWDDSLIK